jgi:hypothetical protein
MMINQLNPLEPAAGDSPQGFSARKSDAVPHKF